MFEKYKTLLQDLKNKGQWRQIPDLHHEGKWVQRDGQAMLNWSSNDYLGLAADADLQKQFLQQYTDYLPQFSASSSRLLTGSSEIHRDLEENLAKLFEREAALILNSGYHANIGILPALADKNTLIVADKLVHASLIDGIRLSGADFVRYRHNDLQQLTQILTRRHQDFKRVIVVSESVFSMDGDCADLKQLVSLKKQFGNVMLYVDEAHAFGVYGQKGLGLAEAQNCIHEIDILVGTFGKAAASMGAYLICDAIIKDYLINTMRSLIFSTALPPVSVAWTHFIVQKLPEFSNQRIHLQHLSQQLRQFLMQEKGVLMPSESHIVPYILGNNEKTLAFSGSLQAKGHYCLPIRVPTVPQGTARIRFSLSANINQNELQQLMDCLDDLMQ